MTKLILHTSGSTAEPKEISHTWDNLQSHIQRSIKEIGLTDKDIVLDPFPGNVIAHYTVTAIPALTVGAQLISMKFDLKNYINTFNRYRPTYTAMIPRFYEALKKLDQWDSIDMSCVRYMVVGSGPIPQIMIDDLRNRGVQLVANWYGMTEMPPPVFVGYNTASFDFSPKAGYDVDFSTEGECIINGFYTGDIFDVTNKKFLYRKSNGTNGTWKNTI